MVLPMGLTFAPAMFMQVINSFFANLLHHGIIVFFNDILVYSHTRDEHVQLLHLVFDKLCKHCFYCKLKIRSFFYTTSTLIGFDITPDGLKISNTKVKSFCNWPQAMTMK